MAIDIKEKISELVKKVTSDPSTLENFKKDPSGTVEKLVGVKLPKDQIDQIVAGIKAKLGADSLADAAKALGGLFGKK